MNSIVLGGMTDHLSLHPHIISLMATPFPASPSSGPAHNAITTISPSSLRHPPLPSPRRHSFTDRSPTVATFLAYGGLEDETKSFVSGTIVEDAHLPDQAKHSFARPRITPFQLGPAPVKIPSSRLRASSYSSPNFSLPTSDLSRSHSPAFARGLDRYSPKTEPASSLFSSYSGANHLARVAYEDEAHPESPLDTMSFRTRQGQGARASAQLSNGIPAIATPPKPSSPLSVDDEPEILALPTLTATSSSSSIPHYATPLSTPEDSPRPPSAANSRRLSAIALAAVADTPPRTRPAPPPPPKSSARMSQGSSHRDSYESTTSIGGGVRTRSVSSASKYSTSKVGTATASPVGGYPSPPPIALPSTTPVDGLVDPRPRNPSTRTTPALSQAGSSSSRASSSVFTPSSSAVARSSGHSAGGDWRTNSTSESEFGRDDIASGLEDEPDGYKSYSRRTPPMHKLQVNVEAARAPPLGLGLGGLGIEGLDGAAFSPTSLGDDDLQRGLEELARYAQTLPSPLPPPEGDDTTVWHSKRASREKRDPDKTLRLGTLRTTQDAPVSLTASISRSNSSSSIPPERPPLHPRHSSLSGTTKPIPVQQTHKRRATDESIDLGDSEAYLSLDDSGAEDLTTDDEADGSGVPRYLPYGEGESNYGYAESPTTESPAGYWDEDASDPFPEETAPKNVVDFSGRSLETFELDPMTTHLLLANTTTPNLMPNFLAQSMPMLGFRLVVLDIGYCGLTELPYEIASCPRLQELDIRGNRFESANLPAVLGNLISLRVLVADNCGLSNLPHSLAPLRFLHTLSLRNNALRALPSWLCRLVALEVLLVDGNEFIWHWADLVKPLLRERPETSSSASPVDFHSSLSARSSVSASLPTLTEKSSNPTTPDMKDLSVSEFGSTIDSPTPSQEPTFVSSFPSPMLSGSMTPASGHSMSTPPLPTTPHIDLAEAQDRLRRHSDKPAYDSYSPAPDSPALSSDSSNKWGKMFKKVSINKMRPSATLSPNPSGPKRPGGIGEGTRTFSQPITNDESNAAQASKSTATSIFRNRLPSRAKPVPVTLILQEEERKMTNRRSFLKLESLPTLETLINGANAMASSPSVPSPLQSEVLQSEVERKEALASVVAYLHDLDDLMDHAAPSPNPAASSKLEPAPPQTSSSPSLRASPSLGSLSPNLSVSAGSSIRRAQSSRRLPRSHRTNSSPFAQYDDDGSGRTTPLASGAGTPSLPMTVRADASKRDMIVKEIISTEKTYINGLKELCDIYVLAAAVTVSSSTGKKDTVVPNAERKVVFGNVEGIRTFHESAFLPDLLEAVGRSPSRMTPEQSASAAIAISRVIIKHIAFFKIYSSYVNAFDAALNRLQAWNVDSSRPSTGGARSPPPPLGSVSFDASTSVPNLSTSQKKRIRGYLKRCKAHPRHSQINLESYLLLPVQRVPRYRMLLENLLACTPANPNSSPLEPDPTIREALDLISSMASDMNEKKRESEGRQQLLYWQVRIGGSFKSPLVQPHRSLLKTGTVALVRTVKKSSVLVEAGPRGGVVSESGGKVVQVHSLQQETQRKNLIALLCNDMLVFVIQPADPKDTTGPVELFTVMRLGGSRGKRKAAPVSLFGGADGSILRIHLDSRAILYIQCPSRSEAKGWMSAINVQQERTSG